MRHDVIKRQTEAMRSRGWDAILSSSPENFAYVTGFLSPTQPLMRWRHAMALVTVDGACSLLVIDMVPFFLDHSAYCRGIVPNIIRLRRLPAECRSAWVRSSACSFSSHAQP